VAGVTPNNRSKAPIFIVGCGRSGTTVVYELLARHPDVAWISNYTERWPMFPQLALLTRLKRIAPLRDSTFYLVPAPREGFKAWDFYGPTDSAERNRPLTEADVDAESRRRITYLVDTHTRYQGALRFLNKNTRNSRRIRYLNAIFEDAIFIHVLRDPRAVVASLLKVHFWADLPLWWMRDLTPHQLIGAGWSRVEVAAEHWRRCVERILEDKEVVGPRYRELRYEELTADPVAVLDKLCAQVDLSGPVAGNVGGKLDVRSRNDKYKTQLTAGELEVIAQRAGPVARKLGYDLPADARAPSGQTGDH
jgi:hypothetical protein